MIGYCGYDCEHCAARSTDREERRRLVEGWKLLFGHAMYTEENVPIARPCTGCRGPGEVADTQCEARGCAVERGVEYCADCPDFPCPKVGKLLGDHSGLFVFCCRDKAVTPEIYERSARQFASMSWNARRLAERGRLPAWTREYLGPHSGDRPGERRPSA